MKSTLTLSMSSFSILNPLTSLSRDRIFALISTKITEKILSEKKKTNQKNKLLANNIAWCYKLLFLLCAYITRDIKTLLSSRWLWNLLQRHKFLRANASRNNLKFRVSEMAFLGVFKRYFPLQMPCCFVKATKTGNDAVDGVQDVSQHCMVWTFHRSKPFKYAFSVIWRCLFFVSSYGKGRWK